MGYFPSVPGFPVIAVAHGGRDAGLCVLLMLWAGVTGGVTVYESTIGTLIRRYRFARKARELYRSIVQDKQLEFSFDEKGWKSQEDVGNELPWSDLEYAGQQDGIIRLQAGRAHALVPVRALSLESLSQLRRLLDPARAQKIYVSGGLCRSEVSPTGAKEQPKGDTTPSSQTHVCGGNSRRCKTTRR